MKQKLSLTRAGLILLFTVILSLAVVLAVLMIRKEKRTTREEMAKLESEIALAEADLATKQDYLSKAEKLAASYDYDAAIALLSELPMSQSDTELVDTIASYNAAKAGLIAVDVAEVPHLYFHSLICDSYRAFDTVSWGVNSVNSVNANHLTMDEFDRILQQLYDNGYILVRMRDLVDETVNENGETVLTASTHLRLPSGKKPYVISVDDVTYPHAYEGKGFADRLVFDENGAVKARYVDATGTEFVGDYDVIPRLNSFFEQHPDGAYKGARGLIALTGYNGVLGYRTDPAYSENGERSNLQERYITRHEGFDYDTEISEAKKMAQALKDGGWEFACHTYDHILPGSVSYEYFTADYEKWKTYVEPITGPVDTFIFPKNGDISDWHAYSADTNAIYGYLKDEGYRFFANSDLSQTTWIQRTDSYLRVSRLPVGGFSLYRIFSGSTDKNVFESLFDVSTVYNTNRPEPVKAADVL